MRKKLSKAKADMFLGIVGYGLMVFAGWFVLGLAAVIFGIGLAMFVLSTVDV
jgi:hypothetical protein